MQVSNAMFFQLQIPPCNLQQLEMQSGLYSVINSFD